jgi:long-chain fatty acid transport protein
VNRGARALMAALAGALAPAAGGPAVASPLFELVGGLAGDGGMCARVLPAGAASTYFNPALLPEVETDFDLGVFVLRDEIGVGVRARPSAAADVPVAAVDAERPGGGRYPRYGIPTVWLERGKPAEPPDAPLAARPRQGAGSAHNTYSYQVLGMARRLLSGRLAVGLYAMIPYRRFTGAAAFYSDEREQYFSNSLHAELYADRLTATSLAFGAGVRVTPRLSLGVVATLALRTVAVTPTFLSDVGRFEDIMVDSDVGVKAALAPHFAAAYALGAATRLTATVHTPQKTEIGTDFSFLLVNGVEQRAQIRFTHAYLPWTFSAGASHRLGGGAGGGGLTLAAAAIYARWSGYRDRHSEQPLPGYGWYDTLSGVAGLHQRWGDTAASLDVGYHPTPVPDQTGRTSYVDNDRLAAALALSRRGRLAGVRWQLAISAQVHRLLPRDTWKREAAGDAAELVRDEVPDDAVTGGQPVVGREGLQTNNPGWPGFTSAGWVGGGGVQVGVGF